MILKLWLRCSSVDAGFGEIMSWFNLPQQLKIKIDQILYEIGKYQGLNGIFKWYPVFASRNKDGANEDEDEMGCWLPIRTCNAKSPSNQHYPFVQQLNVVPRSSSPPALMLIFHLNIPRLFQYFIKRIIGFLYLRAPSNKVKNSLLCLRLLRVTIWIVKI